MFTEEIITSRNNPIVKWASSLADKKGRDAEKAFLAEGEKLTLEAIEAGLPITHIFISESKSDRILQRLYDALSFKNEINIRLITLSDSAFEKISTEKAPQGVISVIKHLDFFSYIDIIYKKEFFLSPNERAIILCSVRDPGNLGSVIRSAVAFGTDAIILSDDCADVYNPKTVRSAMGSLFRTRIIRVKRLEELIDVMKSLGRRVFAAELKDNSVALSDVDVKRDDAFIIGNEGHGIPKNISDACSGSVYIPISNKTESLNASVAAGIFMWEQSKN